MTLSDYLTRKIPDYYPQMYLDGFTLQEIWAAAHRSMINSIREREQIDTVSIKSEVKVK